MALAQELPTTLRQGMPYAEAREVLLNAGWQAQVFPNQEQDGVMTYLTELGYTEVTACSGTGLGLCAFEFVDADGHKLSVSTANNQRGEEPTLFRWWLVQD
jgi:hypothetical protein